MKTIVEVKKIQVAPNLSATNILVDFEVHGIANVKEFKEKLGDFQLYLDNQTKLKV